MKAKYKDKIIEFSWNDILINAENCIVLKNQQCIYKKDILEEKYKKLNFDKATSTYY